MMMKAAELGWVAAGQEQGRSSSGADQEQRRSRSTALWGRSRAEKSRAELKEGRSWEG